MSSSFKFHKNLVLRTPHFAFVKKFNPTLFGTLIADRIFMEALYLASPVLHSEIEKYVSGKIVNEKDINKIKLSIVKYYQRMYCRSTPFGLFSGCSIVEWGDTNSLKFSSNYLNRSTRLDMHFMCALVQHLEQLPEIKPLLTYYPNNSMYEIGSEFRFIEYRYKTGKRIHQITAIDNTEYLKDVIHAARKGITKEGINKILKRYIDDDKEAETFIEELLESQVLISELEPSITGIGFIQEVIQKLQIINLNSNETIQFWLGKLKTIETYVANIDLKKTNSHEAYKDILKIADELKIDYQESKFFQVDMFKELDINSVDKSIQNTLTECVNFLGGLNDDVSNNNLKKFAKRFYERYEDNSMPLAIVLDGETGIGYPDNVGNLVSPLSDNVPAVNILEEESQYISLNKKQNWLHSKLRDAVISKEKVINITEEDIKDYKFKESNFPPSMSIMFSQINDKEFKLEGCTGTSAVNLLGRFASGNKEINKICKEITKTEKDLNRNIEFAEIIHLPEARTGNVLLHPAFRDYEIPYLAKSSLPKKHQISINDLYVKIVDSNVVLFSKKLGKQIIPRLSNAHNYSYKSLPIYYFLCDLQGQNLQTGLSFDWGFMSRLYDYFPRVVYKNIVLSAATWHFKKEVLNEMSNLIDDTKINNFLEKHKLPRYVLLADGDNELLIDFENQISVNAFLKTIVGRIQIVLKEFLFIESSIIDQSMNWYTNQFIATIIKQVPTYDLNFFTNQEESIKKHNSIGSNWFYVKLYCGLKTIDKLLTEAIKPFTDVLMSKKIIEHWFFIRYKDPNNHLRLRLKLTNRKNVGTAVRYFTIYFNAFEQNGLVWKIQTDAYMPEYKRYGKNTMEMSEQLFYWDSVSMIPFLEMTQGDERENLRWLFGMKKIDELLNGFQFNINDKINLLAKLKDGFSKEFNYNKETKNAINKIYADARVKIMKMFFGDNELDNEFTQLQTIIKNFRKTIEEATMEIQKVNESGNLQVDLFDLLGSHIHMIMNRLFPTQQRKNEMIVYVLLYKLYVSLNAISVNKK